MDPVINRMAIPRRRGRPSAEEIAARPPPVPAKLDAATHRPLCQSCGTPTLVRHGIGIRKSDDAQLLRCTRCGRTFAGMLLLSAIGGTRVIGKPG